MQALNIKITIMYGEKRMRQDKWDFSEIKKIYVACPAYIKTGGTELLHQLVYEVSKYRPCSIYYLNCHAKNPTPLEFQKYVNDYVTHIPYADINKENIIIIPETATEMLYRYPEMKCIIWWLSVDNFKREEKDFLDVIIREWGKSKFSFYRFHNKCLHLVQSQYAMDYLKRHGIKKQAICFLSDYINTEYYNCHNKERENIILYNPKKGTEFTQMIMQAAKDMRFIPIINMSNMEVINLMQRAKVYIDFGNHPGKDRIPREAALQGLCVITGKDGAAQNMVDVPIKKSFKIKARKKNIPHIINTIRQCLSEYEENQKLFVPYIEFILAEKAKFENTIKQLFG